MAQSNNFGVILLYTSTCLICKKEFGMPFSDFRYKDIKYNHGKQQVCDQCGKAVQEEYQKITDSPEMVDLWDKVLRSRSR